MSPTRRKAASLRAALLAALLATLAACSTAKPVPPTVHVADLRLLESSVFEQRFEIVLAIGNPNDFDLALDGLTFDLEVNDEAFASGFSNQAVTIPRLGEKRVSVDASTTLVAVVRQMMLLAKRGDLSYRLRGLAYLGGLQRHSVPYESEGRVRLLPAGGSGQPI